MFKNKRRLFVTRLPKRSPQLWLPAFVSVKQWNIFEKYVDVSLCTQWISFIYFFFKVVLCSIREIGTQKPNTWTDFWWYWGSTAATFGSCCHLSCQETDCCEPGPASSNYSASCSKSKAVDWKEIWHGDVAATDKDVCWTIRLKKKEKKGKVATKISAGNKCVFQKRWFVMWRN